MKKYFLKLASAILFLTIFLPSSNIEAITVAQKDLESRKANLILKIDGAVVKIDLLQAKIEANTYTDQDKKASVLASLQQIENGLLAYKTKVAAVTTEAELQALNSEVLNYLIDNKNVLKEAAKEIIINVGKNAQVKAQAMLGQIEKLIVILELTCPAAKTLIAEIEVQISQLKTEITVLAGAITSKDTLTIKTYTASINNLIKEIIANILQIQESCL